ncbi:Mu transposase C-terminal domain-containing protein, partial [Desulfosarcina cetonica]
MKSALNRLCGCPHKRFFQTAQHQFEAEVRAGDLLTLEQLNRALSAWLSVAYHKDIHSETGQSPEDRYRQGLTIIRQVDMSRVIESFMQAIPRTVNRTFSDVQINKRFYRVDPKLRGDRVEVRFDPFSTWDKVQIHSLDGQYLGTGLLHQRQTGLPAAPDPCRGKPKHNYTDLLIQQHRQELAEKAGGIDYRNIVEHRRWPFHQFASTVAQLLGFKAGLTALCSGDLEALKKVYNQSSAIDRQMVKNAFENARQPSVPYIIA